MELLTVLEELVNENLYHIVCSNARNKELGEKTKVRPVMLKGKLMFQAETFVGPKAFHDNFGKEELIAFLSEKMASQYKQMSIENACASATVLVSKKGKMTVKKSNKKLDDNAKSVMIQDHNRKKKYLLEEGITVPFLVDLGVQTQDGKIVHAKYDKFRQINRFLEFVEDIIPSLPQDRTIRILDFGCGKSYLTFAVYYYLHEIRKYDLKVTGLDLKQDVIAKCNHLRDKYGYSGLEFEIGNIKDYTGETQADMVITLHACDTATDYALEKALKWGAMVILSVPCCQHEINKQISCDKLSPLFSYGIIQERMSALITDAMRARILEANGYDTQILEFIDMEHTPKNLMIRAVKNPLKKESVKQSTEDEILMLTKFLNINPTLLNLLETKSE